MRLLNYDINVVYVQGSKMYFADTLSRVHSTKTTPDNLFDNDVTVAEMTIIDDGFDCIVKNS